MDDLFDEPASPPPNSEPGTALIPRATIEDVVAAHDAALKLYADAWLLLSAAQDGIKAAQAMAAKAHPGRDHNRYSYHQAPEVEAFAKALQLPPRDQYLRTARKLLGAEVWAWIIEHTQLEHLMDAEAKKQLQDQMRYVPDKTDRDGQLITGEEVERGLPPLTVDNVYATLEQFQRDAGMIFRRGVANVFSGLDRRFRSHDGFKIGSRIILDRAFDGFGHWCYSSYGHDTRDKLIDVERVLKILDGEDVRHGHYTSTIGAIDSRRGHAYGARQTEVATEHFVVRIWKNGNAHLWFARKDLLAKVNKLLGEWYGEVIGDGQTKEDDPLGTPKTTPAKYFGFYPTPGGLADDAIKAADIQRFKDDPPLRILEPSAGTGNLARLCAAEREDMGPRERQSYEERRAYKPGRWRPIVDCVEIQPCYATELEAAGIYNRVWCRDFLSIQPSETGLYDRIVMNPPFDMERDVDHVAHALKFLAEDGTLVAIMAAGVEFRQTRKAKAFRALMIRMHARFNDLPAGSFAEQGTNVN